MTALGEAVTRQVLEEARRGAGGGAALAAALQDANVGPDSGAYSVSAISNWIKGRTRPPADVLLAAAALYGISLDKPLGLLPNTRRPASAEGSAGAEVPVKIGADDCVIEAESDGELTRLKVYSNRLTTGFGTIQMTWLRLAGEDVQEVWSSWGARVGGTDDQS